MSQKATESRNSDVAGAVELAMRPGHTISVVPTAAHVEVRLGGRLLAHTDRAMKLDETGLPARYYLPPYDVQMDSNRIARPIGLEFSGFTRRIRAL